MSASDANRIENYLLCLSVLFDLKKQRYFSGFATYLAFLVISHDCLSLFYKERIRLSIKNKTATALFFVYGAFIKRQSNKKQIIFLLKSKLASTLKINLDTIENAISPATGKDCWSLIFVHLKIIADCSSKKYLNRRTILNTG